MNEILQRQETIADDDRHIKSRICSNILTSTTFSIADAKPIEATKSSFSFWELRTKDKNLVQYLEEKDELNLFKSFHYPYKERKIRLQRSRVDAVKRDDENNIDVMERSDGNVMKHNDKDAIIRIHEDEIRRNEGGVLIPEHNNEADEVEDVKMKIDENVEKHSDQDVTKHSDKDVAQLTDEGIIKDDAFICFSVHPGGVYKPYYISREYNVNFKSPDYVAGLYSRPR